MGDFSTAESTNQTFAKPPIQPLLPLPVVNRRDHRGRASQWPRRAEIDEFVLEELRKEIQKHEEEEKQVEMNNTKETATNDINQVNYTGKEPIIFVYSKFLKKLLDEWFPYYTQMTEYITKALNNNNLKTNRTQTALKEEGKRFQELMKSILVSIQSEEVESPFDSTLLLYDCFEHFIIERIFPLVFSCKEIRQRDIKIIERIKSFSFITLEHLDLKVKLQKNDFEKSKQELCQMNSFHSPHSKISKIVSCSEYVTKSLQKKSILKKKTNVSADDFLPALVYSVLQSNPPNLISTVEFINNFRDVSLMSTKMSYFYSSFCIAVAFIERLDANSLKIDPQLFSSLTDNQNYTQKKKSFLDEKKEGISEEGKEEHEEKKDLIIEKETLKREVEQEKKTKENEQTKDVETSINSESEKEKVEQRENNTNTYRRSYWQKGSVTRKRVFLQTDSK